MVISLRHSKFYLLALIVGLGTTQVSLGNELPEPVVVTDVSKDPKNKSLTMNLTQGDDAIAADFQYDQNEIMNPTVIAQLLKEQQRLRHEWLIFVREFLTSKKVYFGMKLGFTEEDRIEFIKSLESFEAVDEYFQRLTPREKKAIGLAYRAKTFDPMALKRFYARYLGLNEKTSLHAVDQKIAELQKTNPSLITEMHRVFHVNHDGMGYRLWSSVSRPWNTQLHGFPTQSALFFVAIGGVMMTQLMTDYAANPAAMFQHLESIKDPVSHVAFFSFMAANGLVGDFLTGKWGAPLKGMSSAKFRQAAIPYIGMTAGMLVSNLTHEVANLAKICASKLLGKEASPIEQMIMKMQGAQYQDPCDAAQKEFFNFENKVEQYLPMIVSMSLSTAGSTVIQQALVRGTSKGVSALSKWSTSDPSKKLVKASSRALIQGAKTGTRASMKIVGFLLNIGVRANPITGFAFTSLTVGAIVYSTAQNFAFVYLDTIMIPWLSKKWAQVWRAGSVADADKNLKMSLEYHEQKNWVSDTRDRGCGAAGMSPRSYQCPSNMVFHLEEFQKQMDAWRMQNHAKFFTGIQVWNQITTELMNEFNEAQKFYTQYVRDVFTSKRVMLKKSYLERTGKTEEDKKITDGDRNFMQFLPFRKTPLFGVGPLGHKECQANDIAVLKALAAAASQGGNKAAQAPAAPAEKEECESDISLYINHPDRMEGFQKNRVQHILNVFGAIYNMPRKNLPFKEKIELTGIPFLDKDLIEENEKAEKIEAAEKPYLKTKSLAQLEKEGAFRKQLNDYLESSLQGNRSKSIQELVELLKNKEGQIDPKEILENMNPPGREFLKTLLSDLQSMDPLIMGKALARMNDQIRNPRLSDWALSLVLKSMRMGMGNPNPILVTGGLIPYIYHEQNRSNASYSSIKKDKSGYKFKSFTEFMIYQMLCGPQANSNEVITEWAPFGEKYPLLPPNFHPPRISTVQNLTFKYTRPSARHGTPVTRELNVCKPSVGLLDNLQFDELYYAEIFVNGSKQPSSLFEILNSTIPSSVLGDVTPNANRRDDGNTMEDIISMQNKSRVDQWWSQSVKTPFRTLFTKLDNRYQGLLVELYKGLQSDEYELEIWGTDAMGHPDPTQKTTVLARPMKRTEASRSLLQSNVEELNIYMRILGELENSRVQTAAQSGQQSAKPQRVVFDKSKKSLVAQLREDPVAYVGSQSEILGHIKTVIELLRKVSVHNDENGQQRVKVGDFSGNLKKVQSEATVALKKYSDHLKSLKYADKTQEKLMATALRGLEKSFQNLAVYLLNIQLANYSMIDNLDERVNEGLSSQNKAPVNTSSSRAK